MRGGESLWTSRGSRSSRSWSRSSRSRSRRSSSSSSSSSRRCGHPRANLVVEQFPNWIGSSHNSGIILCISVGVCASAHLAPLSLGSSLTRLLSHKEPQGSQQQGSSLTWLLSHFSRTSRKSNMFLEFKMVSKTHLSLGSSLTCLLSHFSRTPRTSRTRITAQD